MMVQVAFGRGEIWLRHWCPDWKRSRGYGFLSKHRNVFPRGDLGAESLLCLKPVLITLQLLLRDRVTELSPQGSGTLLAALGDRGGLLSGGGAGHHSIILCGRVPFVTSVAGMADVFWTVSTYHSLY